MYFYIERRIYTYPIHILFFYFFGLFRYFLELELKLKLKCTYTTFFFHFIFVRARTNRWYLFYLHFISVDRANANKLFRAK